MTNKQKHNKIHIIKSGGEWKYPYIMSNCVQIYNKNVFTEEYLKKHISRKDFKKYKNLVNNKIKLDKEFAEKIAKVMKKWAIERGATHYSHWFQPLTGNIAEKQTSFLSIDLDNNPILEFSASALITGEIDASSFPNGGLRSIFEARGLTGWDYTYPAFLKEDSSGIVLCIPTVLKSLDGNSLDKRRPLLNSCEALNKQALRILKLFGDTESTGIFSAVGIEQEYFLVKKDLYKQRKDLMLTGRTLFGRELIATKKTHYMSSISEKTGNFMKEAEERMWKLGIPAQVKHNEVAPRQYEIVPHYENLKNAANHDFLTMETLEREAKLHDVVCLLDEKPFKGINGSGKHNNWSMSTKEGKQLFTYGKTPVDNARFITMIVALITALDNHSDLIRATVASNGNDNRLSGFEAPSSIISIYLGKELTDVFEELVNDTNNKIKLGKTSLALSSINITDRNRTSPFAFLGNRFEFRMPGASSSVTVCNTVLNTIMAESLSNIANQLENSNDFYSDLKRVIVNLYKKHSRIVYNGNSYAEEWEKEAKSRGLKNIKRAPEAFKAFITEDSIKMFEEFNVYRQEESISRYKIKIEKYIKSVKTEANIMVEIASQDIFPQVIKYINFIQESIDKSKELSFLKDKLKSVTKLTKQLDEESSKLVKNLSKLDSLDEIEKKAYYCSNEMKNQMQILREVADTLEGMVPREYWPMPTYSELLS